MNYSNQLLTDHEISTLGLLLGTRWSSISGPDMHQENLAIGSVDLSTEAGSLTLSLKLQILDIGGEPDDYPCLHVSDWVPRPAPVLQNGNTYFHGRGEVVRSVLFLEETTRGTSMGELAFENIAHTAVTVQLSTSWITIVRSSHLSDTFDIQRTSTLEDVVLPETLDEWESDLMFQVDISRSWTTVS